MKKIKKLLVAWVCHDALKEIPIVQVLQLPSQSHLIDPSIACYSEFDRQLAFSLEHASGRKMTAAQKAWVVHLSAAMRQGHTCVKYENGVISPSPEMLMEEGAEMDPQLISLLQSGFDQLHELTLLDPSLVQDENRLYFRRYFQIETESIQAIRTLSQTPPRFACDQGLVDLLLAEVVQKGLLDQVQADSIAQAAQKSLCWITGGPGTGKTHTAGQLIRVLYLAASLEAKNNFRLILTAPTGKAATQLNLSVTRAIGSLEGFPAVEGQTLHRLLSLGGPLTQSKTLIHADCILIDEASMIDMQLMSQLLTSIQPGTRVILLGDADQLPAVDVGAPFAHFLEAGQGNQSIGSVMRLVKSQRTQSLQLLEFAKSVQAGDEKSVFKLLQESDRSALEYIPFTSIKEAKTRLFDLASPFFQYSTEKFEDPLVVQKLLGQFRLLSSLREGELGVEGLNQLLHEGVKGYSRAYPLLATRNQPDLELWNGDMGICARYASQESVFFLQNGKIRSIPYFQISAATYGYCVSVHKSQGSEWDEVLLVLPEGSERFGKELLYTAATRAKKHLRILAKEETLRKMITRTHLRHSGIIDRMKKKV